MTLIKCRVQYIWCNAFVSGIVPLDNAHSLPHCVNPGNSRDCGKGK